MTYLSTKYFRSLNFSVKGGKRENEQEKNKRIMNYAPKTIIKKNISNTNIIIEKY